MYVVHRLGLVIHLACRHSFSIYFEYRYSLGIFLSSFVVKNTQLLKIKYTFPTKCTVVYKSFRALLGNILVPAWSLLSLLT